MQLTAAIKPTTKAIATFNIGRGLIGDNSSDNSALESTVTLSTLIIFATSPLNTSAVVLAISRANFGSLSCAVTATTCESFH